MLTDIRQTEEYANYLKTMGWVVERIENVNYFIKKFPLIGSVIKVQRPGKLDFDTVNRLARKYRVFQIIIEPKDINFELGIRNNGFKLSKSPYLPSKTLVLDLTKSKKTLLSQMKKDAVFAIKKSEHIEVREARNTKDIKNFHKAWKTSVGFKRFVPPSDQLINLKKSFTQNPALFLTSHNGFGKIIGGALFTRTSHGVAYYWQAFTDKEGRSTLSQYSLVWQGILWANSQKCSVFDFEGIYDSRFPNKSWLGFTHFKKSFGGKEIEYPGAFTKLRFPI